MEIVLPHKFEPRPYQVPLMKAMDNSCRHAVEVWHRRGGKDLTGIAITSKKIFERVGTYYHWLPFYSQGRKIIWDGIDKDGVRFLDRFPKELIAKKNEQEMRIEFKNGSAWQVVGCDNINAVVGTNPIGNIWSEYSLSKREARDFIRPIIAENGGWEIFLYTPRGMNHGWQILQQARQEGWFNEILTVHDTHAIPDDVLELEKRQMPQALYEQEYECKFIEGAGQFFTRIKENVWSGDLEPEAGHAYQIGVDIAKYQDYTVITPFDLSNFRAGKQERFNQTDYNLIKSKTEAATYRFNNGKIIPDSTGVGDPITEDLMNKGLNVEPFKFTEKSRMDLLTNLQILLAQDRIRIPNDEILISELESFQYSLGETGRLRVEVPDGLHDDCVMSLALSVWGIREPINVIGRHEEEQIGIYNQQSYE